LPLFKATLCCLLRKTASFLGPSIAVYICLML
jgi:hypothetical protein